MLVETESLFCSILQAVTAVCIAQVQARYQLHNPDAARPARRIYVGGLPPDTVDVRGSTLMFCCDASTSGNLYCCKQLAC